MNICAKLYKKVTPLVGGFTVAILTFWLLLAAVYLPTYYSYTEYKEHRSTSEYMSDAKREVAYACEVELILKWSVAFCFIFSCVLGKMTQITMTRLAHNRKYISELETIDIETGITTKAHFLAVAQKELISSIRYTYPVSVVLIKINNLERSPESRKNILANELISILHDTVRSKDILARWSEHTYAVLCPYTTADKCKEFATRIEANAHQNPNITCSYGIASHVPSRDVCMTDLMNRASAALLETELHGKSNIISV